MVVFFVGCATIQPDKDLKLSVEELNTMQKDPNLTPAQKIILKHAESGLKNAIQIQKENVILEKKVISESHKAGAGTLTYWLIGLAFLGIAAFIFSKVVKII